MLVSVSGGQGSGKSTLIASLLQRGYPVITRKTSRSILSDWAVSLDEINDNPELTIRFQIEILARKQQDEIDAVNSDNLFITERTYADLFVYALITLGKNNKYSDWLDDYYFQCLAAQSTYAHTLYLKSGHFKPVSDGVRGSNVHYSRMSDLTMFDYTKRMQPLNITIIDTPSIEERTSIAIDVIQLIQPQQKKEQL